MKRRGSVLVSVLIASSLLLVVGTIVSSTVINTTKLNQRYSKNIDLELAAKSALNYGIDYLTQNYKTIPEEGKNFKGMFGDYDNITESTHISRVGNVFTVIGKAWLDGNEEISAEESTVIEISDNDNSSNNGNSTPDPTPNPKPDEPKDSESADRTLVFNKLFNIGKNITWFGDNNQNAIPSFQYGVSCEVGDNNKVNNEKVYPEKNESLSNLNINLNLDKISNIISSYAKVESITHNTSSISLENETVVYNKLYGNNLRIKAAKSNILFENGGNSYNDNFIENLDGSEMIIDGNSEFDKLNILSMNNSKLIINGDLKIKNEFSINQQNSSNDNNLILINGDFTINGNGPKINLKNSIIIVSGNFNVGNQLNLEVENSSIICIENNEKKNLGYKTGNLDFGTNPTVINSKGNYLYCSGDFKVGNVMNIKNRPGDSDIKSEFINSIINKFLIISNN